MSSKMSSNSMKKPELLLELIELAGTELDEELDDEILPARYGLSRLYLFGLTVTQSSARMPPVSPESGFQDQNVHGMCSPLIS